VSNLLWNDLKFFSPTGGGLRGVYSTWFYLVLYIPLNLPLVQ